jgi:hypothetical protein
MLHRVIQSFVSMKRFWRTTKLSDACRVIGSFAQRPCPVRDTASLGCLHSKRRKKWGFGSSDPYLVLDLVLR